MQIDTSSKKQETSDDQFKEIMRSKINEFMASRAVKKRIGEMVGKSANRFSVNLDELRGQSQDLANFALKRPIDALNMFEQQLDQAVKDLKDDSGKGQNDKQAAMSNDKAFPTKVKKYYVNFEGNFGRNHVTPRGLKANLINQLVTVQGIVTRMSIVKPMIQTSIHYCEATKKGLVVNFQDDTNLGDLAEKENNNPGSGSTAFPTQDAQGNKLTAEYGYCVYKDSQLVTIQEMPEMAPPGQLPRSIQVIL